MGLFLVIPSLLDWKLVKSRGILSTHFRERGVRPFFPRLSIAVSAGSSGEGHEQRTPHFTAGSAVRVK